jgi:hypothetical protein
MLLKSSGGNGSSLKPWDVGSPERLQATLSEINSEPVGEITLSDRSTVKVSKFVGRDGKKRVDIRLFVAGERYTGPTRRGVSLPVDRLGDLIALLQRVQ